MTAMEQAFARVGIHGYGARQVGRQLQPAAPVVQRPIPRIAIKDRLVEERAAIAVMSDDDLLFEEAALAENLESVQLELRLAQDGDVERASDWRVKAQRAAAILKGRLSLCRLEIDRRRKVVSEARKADQARLLAEQTAKAHERKLANIAAASQRDAGQIRRFVSHAKAMLPAETFTAIWEAVYAEEGAG